MPTQPWAMGAKDVVQAVMVGEGAMVIAATTSNVSTVGQWDTMHLSAQKLLKMHSEC